MIRKFIAAVALLAFSILAQAQLTASQITTLKATCAAAPACLSLANAGDDAGLAGWMNTTDATFIVWRTSVTRDEVLQSDSYDWTRVDNLSVGKARIWDQMFANSAASINPGKANIRAGIDAVWVGTQADLNVRAAVYVVCKRPATRAEKGLATGTGTSGSPAVLAWEGTVSQAEASLMR